MHLGPVEACLLAMNTSCMHAAHVMKGRPGLEQGEGAESCKNVVAGGGEGQKEEDCRMQLVEGPEEGSA